MASSLSQRQSVVSPIEATKPRRTTSPLISAMLKRESGRPRVWGSSQASALIVTTTLGGKAGSSPAAGLFIKACQAVLEEALAPFADDLPRGIEPCSDLVIGEPQGSVEDDLGPHDVSIR